MNILLIFHITVALASLAVTAFTFFLPSNRRLRVSQALIALTLGSGTYLVFSMKVNILRVCVMGLIYTAIVSYCIVLASRKLAMESSSSKN